MVSALPTVTRIRHECGVQYGASGPLSGQASLRCGPVGRLSVGITEARLMGHGQRSFLEP